MFECECGQKIVRRTLSHIHHWETPTDIYQRITTSEDMKYAYPTPLLLARDRALPAITFLLVNRISMSLMLKNSQFDRGSNPDFIVVKDLNINKNISGGIPIRDEFFLPRSGDLAPLTQLVETYLEMLGPDQKLFPMTRQWALTIVTQKTKGMWDHWLRSMAEKYYANKIKAMGSASPESDLAHLVGVKSTDSVRPYLGFTAWDILKKEISK